jgi:biotin transport system substrate-specific component
MKTKNLAFCGLFAALLVICAWLSLPIGSTPITLQTFGLFLCLGTLSGKYGTISVFTYLLLGAVGFPAFSGFRGGLGVLLDATGGYLLGFLAAALLYWLITALWGSSPAVKLLAMVFGLIACYFFGTLWFSLLYLQQNSTATISFVLLKCVLPYLLPDAIKLAIAWQLSKRLSPFLDK